MSSAIALPERSAMVYANGGAVSAKEAFRENAGGVYHALARL